MKVNTTKQTETSRAMNDAQIERAFDGVAGTLKKQPKRTVRVPRNNLESDVIELGYNGRMYLIRRGTDVELPAPIIEILERAHIL